MNEQGPPEGSDGFHLTQWLDVDTGGAPPGEAATERVVDETGSATPDAPYDGFGFAEWIADGDGDLQLPELPEDDTRLPARTTDDDLPAVPYAVPPSYRPAVHPTVAATVALFLTAATLALLTVGGVVPPLGPVTGLPA